MLVGTMAGVHHLHYLARLSLQLAPDQRDQGTMLNDGQRVGRADLGECWEHVQGTYVALRELLWSRVGVENWRLRQVVCEDAGNHSLSRDLRERFENLFDWGADPPVPDEWKGWGRTWRIVDASDGPTLAVGP